MSHRFTTHLRIPYIVLLLIALLAGGAMSMATPTSAQASGNVSPVVGKNQPHLFHPRGKAPLQIGSGGNVSNHGGSVMNGNSYVYAIFWEPTGRVSANYNTLIKRYFVDVGFSPLYQIAQQYGDDTGVPPVNAVLAGSWVDTRAFPANPMQDTDIRIEVAHAQQQNGWSSSIHNIFFVFTESGESICDGSNGCFGSSFCAYHGHFDANTIYAIVPYVPDISGCSAGHTPNNDVVDSTINVTSHEQMEAATDPNGTAWYDSSGMEIGDKCAFKFGPVDSSGADVHWGINGDPYIVQMEWDNSSSTCQIGVGAAPVAHPNPNLSSPAVLRDASGNQYAYINAGGVLEEDFYSATTKQWIGPWAIGGNISGTPSALLDGSGNQYVYFNNGGLPEEDFYNHGTNSWSGPWAIGGNITGSPSALLDGSGNQYVYFNNGGLPEEDFYNHGTNSWSGPWAIGGSIIGSPVVIRDGGGNQYAYFDSGGRVVEDFYSVATNTWSGPWAIGGNITGLPSVLLDGSGNQYVYFNNGGLPEEDFYNHGTNSWSGPWAIGGNIIGSPSALLDGSGNQYVYFDNGGLPDEDFYSVTTNTWSGPWTIGGTIVNSPVAVRDPSNNQYVYFNSAGFFVENYYTSSLNKWLGPSPIGGSSNV
ncbi:MAG TPA: hypothetical protein VJ761_15340 [Ktedonobacteraceae bacterium]|nr:hypothetical protein [Ktedonobacteraceae bacterium]